MEHLFQILDRLGSMNLIFGPGVTTSEMAKKRGGGQEASFILASSVDYSVVQRLVCILFYLCNMLLSFGIFYWDFSCHYRLPSIYYMPLSTSSFVTQHYLVLLVKL